MKRPFIVYIAFIPIIVLIVFIVIVIFARTESVQNFFSKAIDSFTNKDIVSPSLKDMTYDKYTFKALKDTKYNASEIKIGNVIKDEKNFTSRIFYFTVDDPSMSSGQGKKVSGLINIPKQAGTYPVLVMFRGYVDKEKFTTGEGTRNSGELFAYNGFITLAPDFLGYGESDMPSDKPLEERFQTYLTALTLLESIKNLNTGLLEANITVKADQNKVAIWGHSNGGHITIAALELTGSKYPASLWAPVSKPFPYSILYYTDSYDDHGKALRKVVATFEKDYDVEDYSPSNYFDWIEAPVQVQQGGADESVPIQWSNDLVKELKDRGKDVEYFTYPDEDHNFGHGSWPTLIERSVDFYKKNLGL